MTFFGHHWALFMFCVWMEDSMKWISHAWTKGKLVSVLVLSNRRVCSVRGKYARVEGCEGKGSHSSDWKLFSTLTNAFTSPRINFPTSRKRNHNPHRSPPLSAKLSPLGIGTASQVGCYLSSLSRFTLSYSHLIPSHPHRFSWSEEQPWFVKQLTHQLRSLFKDTHFQP